MHGHAGENPREGDLADGGADDVHGLELDQLVGVEVEVVGEAGDVGIVWEVSSVQYMCKLRIGTN